MSRRGDDDARPSRLHGAAAESTAAAVAFAAGLFLAGHHPLWPVATSVAFIAWTVAAARVQGLWLLVVPAALPALDFSPWSGWIAFEEFDLLALGAVAGGYAARAVQGRYVRALPAPLPLRRMPDVATALVLVLGATTLLALGRGIADAGGWSFDWFDGYARALNSLRSAKSAVVAVALWPLLRDEIRRDPRCAAERLGRGMQVGLAVVSLAVLWERAASPGLLDFSSRFRTTALFWEMHVGGAAIDAYLAVAMPFAAWGLWTARSRRAFAASGALAAFAVYACLTTFSRGAYVAVTLPLLLLVATRWAKRRTSHNPSQRAQTAAAGAAAVLLPVVVFAVFGSFGAGIVLAGSALLFAASLRLRSMRWRSVAATALTVVLVTETVAVIAGGSFMRDRLQKSESDLVVRLRHWQHGLALPADAVEWSLGIGLGRLPARYAHAVPGGEFPGSVTLVRTDSAAVARVAGPATDQDLGGLYALTQRVAVHRGGPYRAHLQTRAQRPVEIAIDVCERHLLYPRRCQGRLVALPAGVGHDIDVPLDGPSLGPGPWYAPRLGVFSLAVAGAGDAIDVAEVRLSAPDGTELLVNRDFAAGFARWFPTAQAHFNPWHIDNLFLELLIERGVVGLAVFIALLVCAFLRLRSAANDPARIAPFAGASLFGVLLVGATSSVLDVPRVALLVFLVISAAIHLRRHGEHQPLRPGVGVGG